MPRHQLPWYGLSSYGPLLLTWINFNPGVRRYFHPHDIFTPGWKYRYDIFTPSTIFSPLTKSNGKSFCSQISLNFIMCIYNKEPFLYFLWLFNRFLFITDCWYNPLTYPPKHWVSTAKRVSCLNIITSTPHGTRHRVKKHTSYYRWCACHILPLLGGGWKYRKGGGCGGVCEDIVRYFHPGVRI